MANRHLSRTIAMQSLFEWDFNNQAGDLKEIINTHLREFSEARRTAVLCLN